MKRMFALLLVLFSISCLFGSGANQINSSKENNLPDLPAVNITIAGSVRTLTGGPIAGVKLSFYANLKNDSVYTNSEGIYSISVPYGWTGTVTPSLLYYTFSPGSISYSNVTQSSSSQNYTGTPIQTYMISGTIRLLTGGPLAGAKLAVAGGQINDSVFTNSDGTYSFIVPSGWTGTVTPSKTNYSFAPGSKNYTNVLSEQIRQDYVATFISSYTISGIVSVTGAGSLPGVKLSYIGAQINDSVFTNSDGFYSITVPTGWTGTITPSKATYSFLPINRSYTSVSQNWTQQNYAATLITSYTISGFVRYATGGPVAGVKLWYSGNQVSDSVFTNSDGFYSITIPVGWSGSVIPSKIYHTFLPVDLNYLNVSSNMEQQDYTATQYTSYTITGVVKLAGGGSLDGVKLAYVGGQINDSVFTNIDGRYTITVPAGWTGIISPSKPYFTFLPVTRSYTNVLQNWTQQDFAATQMTTRTIAGFVRYSTGAPVAGVKLWFFGNQVSDSVFSNTDGSYIFTIPAGWSGSVIPSKIFHTFLPVDMNYLNVTENLIGQDYTATQISSYTITGTIKFTTGAPLVGVKLSFIGSQISDSVFTNSDGIYSLTVPAGWTGTVIPVKANYSFSPVNRNYTNVAQNWAQQDYTPDIVNSYYISGFVRFATGAPLSGIKMAFSGGQINDSVFTNSEGYYILSVPAGWNGIVTPSQNSYAFTPVSISYSNVSQAYINQNYLAALVSSYTISGFIRNSSGASLPNVKIAFIGGQVNDSVFSNSDGFYSLSIPSGWTGTVTPSIANFSFLPINRNYTTVYQNWTQQDYSATQITSYTITGSVRFATGAPLVGVKLAYVGGIVNDSVFTNSDGIYSITIPVGWSGIVTPSKAGYNFLPVNRNYSNVQQNWLQQDYTPSPVSSYTISGFAMLIGGALIPDVKLVFSNGLTKDSVYTNSDGFYTITVPAGWSGTIIPSKANFTFLPINRNYTSVSANWIRQDYIGTPIPSYLISGFVKLATGAPLAGVKIAFMGGTINDSVFTNSDGFYSLYIPAGWIGLVMPSKSNYSFLPANIAYNNVSSDFTLQNYTASLITSYSISGFVKLATGEPVTGVKMSFSGGTVFDSVFTNTDGFYSLTVPAGWTGIVVPTKTSYYFRPINLNYSNVLQNFTLQNYTATLIPNFTITGSIKFATGAPLTGVKLTFPSGFATDSVFTNSDGIYTITVSLGWTGTVIPSKQGHVFSPVNLSYENVSQDWTQQNYTVSVATSYTISGNVRLATGGAVAGVKIWFFGNQISDSVFTNTDGYYSFSIPVGWSGSVIPSKINYSFLPVDRNYLNVNDNLIREDYTATQITSYTITGAIRFATGAPFIGIKVAFIGGQINDSVFTNSDGIYTFTIPAGWSGIVTPIMPNYSFTPSNRSYTSVSQNWAQQDFTAALITSYTISGSVRLVTGAPLVGVRLWFIGGTVNDSVFTNSDGIYTLTIPVGWSGSVYPYKANYTFSPLNLSYTNVQQNMTQQDYLATLNTSYIISGFVRLLAGDAVPGVKVLFTGGQLNDSVYTNSDGYYTTTVPIGWTGSVVPSKTNYSFSPLNRSYTNVSQNWIRQDYTATNLPYYTISGNVRLAAGTPVVGVKLWFKGDQVNDSVFTNSDGTYSFTIPAGWSGFVIPSKTDFSFLPVDRNYINVNENQIRQDYTATSTASFTISGSVRFVTGGPLAGVKLAIIGGAINDSVFTNSDGYYVLTVPSGWTGIVTPSKLNYTFLPLNRSYTNVLQNWTQQDYAATLITYHTISGQVVYANQAATPLSSVKVFLSTQGMLDSTTTDQSGNYSFNLKANGTYNLSCKSTKPWGGANSTDALLIRKYVVESVTFDALQMKASDLNLSGSINSTDALLLRKRIVFADSVYAAGDWVFESPSITVNGAEVIQKMRGLCTGDVNASDVPVVAKSSAAFYFNQKGNDAKISKEMIDLPVSIDKGIRLGALTFAINYPNDKVEITGIESKIAGICSAFANGVITIAWDDLNPVSFKSGETLFTVKLKCRDAKLNFSSPDFSYSAESELADENGNPIEKTIYSIPSINTSVLENYKLDQNYPNPFNPETTIRYFIPKESVVLIEVYNTLGAKVKELVNETKGAGNYELKFKGADLSSGIYFYSIKSKATDGSDSFNSVKKLILMK